MNNVSLDPTLAPIVASILTFFGIVITLYYKYRKKPRTNDEQTQTVFNQINQFIADQNQDRDYLKNEVRQLRIDVRLQQLEIEKLRSEGRVKDERIDILEGQLDNERKNNKILKTSVEKLTAKLKIYQEKKNGLEASSKRKL